MLPTKPIRRATALTLSLGAIAAPAALAKFELSDSTHIATTARVVRPNPDQQAPRAAANAGPRSEVVSGGGYGGSTYRPTLVRVIVPSHAFDWGDAGIGAAGGVALSMLALGVALVVLPRRSRRPARSRARTA
jgi:hypothetical protein